MEAKTRNAKGEVVKTASAVANEGETLLCLARSGDVETLEEKAENVTFTGETPTAANRTTRSSRGKKALTFKRHGAKTTLPSSCRASIW